TAACRQSADEGGGISARGAIQLRHPVCLTLSCAPREGGVSGPAMPRYKLTIEYNGAPFYGWQVQENGLSIQGALEAAVKAMCGEQVRVHGAGRTDAGVHALGQVAHCDIAKAFVPGRLRDGLNAHLRPNPIAVLAAEIVPDTFEARFSARKRHYLYRIKNTR